MESQPVQWGEVSDHCPCDDDRPDECPHVINEEIVARARAAQFWKMVVADAAIYMSSQEWDEVIAARAAVSTRARTPR